MLTFTHIFKSCSRDSCTVLVIMANIIWQLKIAMPRMFSSEEFLTASWVAGFFSRLVAKKSLFNNDDLEEDIECATHEATTKELTNEVSRKLLPGHPIIWDKYNQYEMTSGGKLNTTKLSVAKLRDICTGLDIAVDVCKGKQAYADKIEEYRQKCHCKVDK